MAGTLDEWESRFWRYDNSEMSVSSFCDVEEVSVASFYRWKKKLAGDFPVPEAETGVSPSFQRVDVVSRDCPVAFAASTRATKIRIAGGVEIELGTDVDVDDTIAGIVRFAIEPKRTSDRPAADVKTESSAGRASC